MAARRVPIAGVVSLSTEVVTADPRPARNLPMPPPAARGDRLAARRDPRTRRRRAAGPVPTDWRGPDRAGRSGAVLPPGKGPQRLRYELRSTGRGCGRES